MKVLMSIALVTCLSVGNLYAKKPEHAGKGNKEKKHKKHNKQNKHFSSEDAKTINTYYKNLPPGLQKKMKRGGKLPAGWNKKVSVGQPVPREYLKVATPVSNDLRLRLKIDSKTRLLQISNKLLKVEIGTNRLLGEIQF